MRVTLTASGHPNITATHGKTLEITRAPDVTRRGTCILGTRSTHDATALRKLRGRAVVELETDFPGRPSARYRLEAECSPFYVDDESLVIRRGPILRQRTFAGMATASAADVDRQLVAVLREPGGTLRVTITADESGGQGVLWVVATPIGNPDDLSPRARAVLASVDTVLAEDTRRFRHLAAAADVTHPPLESHHLANEAGSTGGLIERLSGGARMALVSDAGTPLASDPGFPLVRAAIEAGVAVVPVPGPSAPLAAVVASGLATNPLWFEGYLPRAASRRRMRLRELTGQGVTLVLLESPKRVFDLLEDLDAVAADRSVCVARELTKIHEEFLHGTAAQVRDQIADRGAVLGEVTVVVGPLEDPPPQGEAAAHASDAEAARRLVNSLVADAVPTRAIGRAVEAATGMSRNAAYDFVLSLRDVQGR